LNIGKFIEQKYHLDPILRPYIKGLWFHVCPTTPNKFKLAKDYHDNELFINRRIVHDNINEIIDFIKMNPNVEINY